MKKIIIGVGLVMGLMLTAQAQKFDPVKYEMELIVQDKKLKETMQRNLQECRVRSERAKQYRAYITAHPELNKKYTDSVVEACQKRVADVCGALMSAAESNETK